MLQVQWATFKEFVTQRGLSIQFIQDGDWYYLRAADGFFQLSCEFQANPGNPDCVDFETNFKAQGNKRVDPKDGDGSNIIRSKTTRTGWHYEPRSLDFTTGLNGSLYNRKHGGAGFLDGADYGDAVEKFFDATGAELVKGAEESLEDYQLRLDANCIRTHIDWQSAVEIDIIGATVSVLNPPTGADRAWCWIIVAPDIPEIYGGSVPFMAGGWNLRHFAQDAKTFLDGRGVKAFVPDLVYNSNKMRVVIKHEIGAKIECQFVVEKFNA